MTLSELISPGRVIAEMRSRERFEAIAELIDHLAAAGAIPGGKREAALESFRLREELRSTGIGNGVAIPHCFLDGIGEVAAVFGRSASGIDFQAIDHVPVRFVVLFVVPESQHSLHLAALAAIAKPLNHAETRQRLAAAADEADLLAVLARTA